MATSRRAVRNPVPPSMQVQLARLFVADSREAQTTTRSRTQWRRTLQRVLVELERYLDANVVTDELHRFMLASGLWAASEALKEDDFWPGYVEGITRFALLLLGDYPDHRKQRLRGKRADHYQLKRLRSVNFDQSHEQRAKTLFATFAVGIPKLSVDPLKIWREYASKTRSPTYRGFLQWFRATYPHDYASVL